ncbi:hypothetical protein AGMMS50267_05700 [Spirochaetia bacterium]|nr:hypothetical protein AGMMS50267_05700 [Spirochaetia bacterium]
MSSGTVHTDMTAIPKKIETRKPAFLLPEDQLKGQLTAALQDFTVDYLQDLLHCLFKIEKGKAYKSKAVLLREAAAALCFTDIEIFNCWFYSLPPMTQGILWYITFNEYVSVEYIEARYGALIVTQKKDYWRPILILNPEANLDFLVLSEHHGHLTLAMARYLRTTLKPWFVPPPEALLEYCIFSGQEKKSASKERAEQRPGVPVYDNSIAVAESFPLLCDRLRVMLEGMNGQEKEKAVRGFKKRPIAELQASSAFLSFPMGGIYAPDSIELTARFMLLMKNYKVSRPENAYTEIRNLIRQFFSTETKNPNQWHSPDRNFLECSLLMDHLTRTAGYYLDEDKHLPPSRIILKEVLYKIAEDGRRFDAAKLADYLAFNYDSFVFCNKAYEQSYKLKADTIKIGGLVYTHDDYTDLNPTRIFRNDFIVKPVFKAYLYLFASLGLLEITQKEPPLVRTLKKEKLPLSPYDSLDTVKITEFGRWCLGLTDKQPALPKQQYEAIADRELFLVTVRGKSLERKVYLDRIGQKLGEDRWRISAGSFIAEATHKKEIEERVASFKRLIDPKPEPHWEALFQRVCSRAGLFNEKRNDVHVYSLPDDKAIREELLSDPALKTIALRCEGNMLVVPSKKMKPFLAFLGEHGIAWFA